LLALAIVPFVAGEPALAIGLIILLNGLRSFSGSLANPAWTSLVADIVPDAMRGRYFGSRNIAMGLAALIVAPLAGRVINLANGFGGFPLLGFQLIFVLSFASGMVSTIAFQRIEEPPPSESISRPHQRGDLRRAVRENPAFLGLVLSAFVWNLALQLSGPFFNVFLVSELGATTLVVGLLASVSSLFSLFGQRLFGRWLDTRGSLWVQSVSGLLIPVLPLAWMFVDAPWQVGLINVFGGILWAGYNLSNFNLLLELTPEMQRPRAVALYQLAVFLASVAGPLLGGYLADAISYDFIFGLSAAGRLSGMLLFFAITVRALRSFDEGKDEANGH
jgi:MFS family permease